MEHVTVYLWRLRSISAVHDRMQIKTSGYGKSFLQWKKLIDKCEQLNGDKIIPLSSRNSDTAYGHLVVTKIP